MLEPNCDKLGHRAADCKSKGEGKGQEKGLGKGYGQCREDTNTRLRAACMVRQPAKGKAYMV